jgi:hypothetical protein
MREARRHLLEPLDRSLVARPDLLHGRAARSPCAAEDLVRQAAQPGRLTQCAPLPHHSTASRTDKPSSSVIASSAPPPRRSASRTAPSRSPSAVNTSCATPRGPVNLRGEDALSERGYRRLADVRSSVQVVDCLVTSQRVGAVVDQAIAFVELMPPGSPCSIALTTGWLCRLPAGLRQRSPAQRRERR